MKGLVDLSHAQVITPAYFQRCLFEDDLVLDFALTRTLQFHSCVLRRLKAMGASINGLLSFTQSRCKGGVNLIDSEVSRSAVFNGSQLRSDDAGLAFVADRLKVNEV